MPVLNVPYFTQPDSKHCQATCLKMMAAYLDTRLGQPAQHRDIRQIKTEINSAEGRPSQYKNSWQNFKWWLEREYVDDIQFKLDTTTDSTIAVETIKTAISGSFPIIVSTNHDDTKGHIILVVGLMAMSHGQLVEPPMGPASSDYRFICHDPYGAFDPSLNDPRHGSRRYEGGFSSVTTEHGPGRNVIYDLAAIRRSRNDRHSHKTFLLLRGVSIKR